MKIIIRDARAAEAEQIVSFQQAMALETENMELPYEVISKGVMAVFDDPSKGRYFVAEENNKILGSYLLTPEWSDWRNSYVWWFQSVYVAPEHRRKGIFRLMYQHTMNLALKEEIAGLRLYVETNNERAMKTYAAMGMNGEHYKLFEWLKS